MFKNLHLSESQYQQDLWVLETLKYKRDGFFLDVGAAHYKKLSNTHYLEKEFGWDGICIEGNGNFFQTLIDNRSCTCINSYVSTNTNPTFINKSKTTPGDDKDFGFGDFIDDFNTGITPSMAKGRIIPRLIMDILDDCGTPSIIDYMSIDIEGADFPVMKTIDFDKYQFRTITIEDNIPAYSQAIVDFLTERGYKCLGRIKNLDLAFIKEIL